MASVHTDSLVAMQASVHDGVADARARRERRRGARRWRPDSEARSVSSRSHRALDGYHGLPAPLKRRSRGAGNWIYSERNVRAILHGLQDS